LLASSSDFSFSIDTSSAVPSSSSSSSSSLAALLATSSSSSESLGKIGKIQLLKSGKVRFVTKNGQSYEIKNGLTSSFLQTLMNVDVQQPTAPSSSSVDNPAPPSASSSSEKKKKSTNDKTTATATLLTTEIRGNIHFMGNITKKLVITPSYELGVKRKKGIPSGSSSSASAAGKKGNIGTDHPLMSMNGDGIAGDEVDFSESLMMEIDGES
jgi:hypothetical protein